MDSPIPILLLKTRSQPHDSYEEYFSNPVPDNNADHASLDFQPLFVPVLEHRPHTENLSRLGRLLRSGTLRSHYGGMIFTSQRAVEGWANVVKNLETEHGNNEMASSEPVVENKGIDLSRSNASNTENQNSQSIAYDDSIFPLYTVGPATSRALITLVDESPASSAFSALRPRILGAHTGNGAALARYIQSHYNLLHSHRLFTFYEAPRLPFIPLLGTPGGERIDFGDGRLAKKPLLFLVGETRRDIIPKTLMDEREGEYRIEVEEMEVYATDVMGSFQEDFGRVVQDCTRVKTSGDTPGSDAEIPDARPKVIVVVVFSPQGSETMLRSLGFIDAERNMTRKAKTRWVSSSTTSDSPSQPEPIERHIIIITTIGPTTRDYLKDKFGFDADVCAAKPSPQGVGDGVRAFLKQKGLL